MIRRPPRSTLFPSRRSSDLSEARIRHVELPVAPVDFTSEYPTVCVLMELMKVLTAKDISFERSEEHTSELQSHVNLVCRLLLEKKNSSIWFLITLCAAARNQ